MAQPRKPQLRLRPVQLAEQRTAQRERLALNRLPQPREEESTSIDTLAPFLDWDEFLPAFAQEWEMGPPDWPNAHVTLVGESGSGKTTLARQLLMLRDRVVVIGTKPIDQSLYPPLIAQGFEIAKTFDPQHSPPHVIFTPPLEGEDKDAFAGQAAAVGKALRGIYRSGGWTIYCDELRYLTETLKLSEVMDLLWLQGRSLGIAVVAATQRPVSVPLNAFEQAEHLFLWRIGGERDRKTAAGFLGALQKPVELITEHLPKHEALYVRASEDVMLRTVAARNLSQKGSREG